MAHVTISGLRPSGAINRAVLTPAYTVVAGITVPLGRDLWPWTEPTAGCHAQQMFARRDLRLALSFEAGRARLVNLLRDGGLAAPSHAAYAAGIAVIRIGPLGNVPGAGKLVRVRFLDPADHDGLLRVGLRWEATGIAGDLFPVLDGDLTLAPAGAGTARLVLAGVYRPPLGWLGARLDAAVLHRLADATFSAFLRSVADALASPVPVPGAPAREPGAVRSGPAPETSAI